MSFPHPPHRTTLARAALCCKPKRALTVHGPAAASGTYDKHTGTGGSNGTFLAPARLSSRPSSSIAERPAMTRIDRRTPIGNMAPCLWLRPEQLTHNNLYLHA
jgi:hypothetical protein